MNDDLKELESARIRIRQGSMIEKARKGLLAFTAYTKNDYEINWHNRLIANKLNSFLRKQIRFLMIFAPPRHGKTELVSRRLPAMYHGLFPDNNIMAASYSSSLANDITTDVQRIMDSEEYRQIFPETRIPFADERDPRHHRNSEGHAIKNKNGKYIGQGVGGSFTGRGMNLGIIDDPFKGRKEADSIAFRDSVWKWYVNDFITRMQKDAQILLILTRWHEDDLAGRIIKMMKDNPQSHQFEIIKLAAIREDMDFKEDPRHLGDALWPTKFPLQALKATEALDPRGFTALYQQRPTALEGGIIKHSWLKFYTKQPDVKDFSQIIMSADLAFKDKPESDFVVIQIWGRKNNEKYLLNQFRDRVGFSETVKQIKFMSVRYPQAYIKLIEDKANGPAVLDTLKKEGIGGLIPINPKDSKFSRLQSCSPQFEAGDIYFPDPSLCPWVNTNIDEMINFPNMANDDTVDATSQALNWFEHKRIAMPSVTAL